MHKNDHHNQVLVHLKQRRTVSQVEAIQFFNCYSLSSVISRLRKVGHYIETHYKPNLVNKVTKARYSLERDK